MAISSMTGFARAEGVGEGLAWCWEARSVNGRGLDIRLRLPPGYDAIETAARDAISKRFARGNVAVTLTLERQPGASSLRLNEALLIDLVKAADRAAELTGGTRPDTASLLAMKGVIEIGDNGIEDSDTKLRRERVLLSGLERAINGLSTARKAEGERLDTVLKDQVARIASLTREVRISPSRTPDAVRMRLKDLIERLLDANETFDQDRLHQEAVVAATRIDIEEELTRLEAHVAATHDILAESGAVGRKLDFLAQEFNREANTLCSKANAVDITRLGLALKTVIDQFREQVQNVE